MNEHFENIGYGMKVFVSDSHSFGTDSILLAHFTSPKKRERACDLGTGCGIVPMLWCRNCETESIAAVEIQENAYKQALQSVSESNVSSRVTVINHDLRQIKKVLAHASMDVVSMNPPYKAANTGIKSSKKAEEIARHETECTLSDVTSAAAYLLKFGGRLCMCNRPERLSDTIIAMKQFGIEPKKLRFVSKRPDSQPWLFLIEGRRGGKPHMIVEPLLVMYGDDGEISEEVVKIYGEYKENNK